MSSLEFPSNLPDLGWIVQGSTRPSWQVTVKQSNNNALTLTGATFTGVMRHTESGTKRTLTANNFSITDATNGVYTYAPATADVGGPHGVWIVEVCITISTQTYYRWYRLRILPQLAA